MPDIIDDQELKEREEAATALATEDERHFVDYCIECVKESRESRREVLDQMSLLWDGYCNIMDFGDKQDWQSKIVVDKLFTAVEKAISIIAKIFKNPNYITAEGVEVSDTDVSKHVKEALSYWCSPQKMDFPRKFTDANRMAMAVGLSMEMIPRWEDGMQLDLTEPWKVLRDPDALSGEPQSGNYCIHEEWLDKWKVDKLGKEGYFENVNSVKEGGDPAGLEGNKEEQERRKKMWWQRTTFRKAVLVRIFSGVVLDRKGDLLLPNAKFTIACDTLVRKPEAIPFVNIRWPLISFAPIPHILRYDGRGLIEGVFDLWRMLNRMLSLTMDDFSWVVNRMREIVPELLLDPTDLEMYPGKDIYRLADQIQYPVVKDVLNTTSIDKILVAAKYAAGLIEEGDFVNAMVAGLPGYREQITKGEVEIKTEQSMGIFDSIGTEIEHGAIDVAYAIFETMVLNWNAQSVPTPSRVLGMNEFSSFLERASLEDKKAFLKEQADIKITGISAQFQKAEKVKLLMALKQYAESPLFTQFFKPKELLDETVGALGMYKAPFIKTDDELKTENLGQQIAMALGKVAQSGGPEVQQAIQNFLNSLGIQAPQGLMPEVGGVTPQAGG